ncbi:AAA family ATPase [Vibrio tapetis]|uniref:MoxR-like ATPase n=1 Tax=Vibrio tapetis subsp. tapetis TaxID=1671868 RepID=A0A2N8ZIP0_9VIBR|nr:MoxR family ATPase [Vibrio tapetis]SON51773.1 MoxR-like ATPase [Vibrio tapetis subsp. tapetis]
MNQTQQSVNQLIQRVEQAVIGQRHVVEALVLGLLTKGHVLLEGLPGTAKTRSVKSLAAELETGFGRVQFTPDLLPSDVTGTEVYQDVDGKPSLRFQAGPIFNNIVLADEINRAPAKVQSALLEAMAENTVTIGTQSHALPDLFMVLATQNPIEQEGTYSLPEAQLDRFMLKVSVGYPDDESELGIIQLLRSEEYSALNVEHHQNNGHQGSGNGRAKQAIDPQVIADARKQLVKMEVSPLVEKYIVALVMATRKPERYPDSLLADWILVGASPRASIALDKCSRAYAWLQGRDYVMPDDVRSVAPMVLGHRFSLSYDALADGISRSDIIHTLLDHVEIG